MDETEAGSSVDGVEWDDPAHSQQEWIRVSIARRVVFVVYTLKSNPDGKATVRIIGPRQASRKQRRETPHDAARP
jgi:uncharacterized DUF497 family protein